MKLQKLGGYAAFGIVFDSRGWGIHHFLKIDPIWDSLQHDWRFGQLLRKMNLSQTD